MLSVQLRYANKNRPRQGHPWPVFIFHHLSVFFSVRDMLSTIDRSLSVA
ncbi:MAG: hypothetical protein BSOLF_0185 [Candidatus Carbobacillus altaicus]|uniref:Uncharacterized protein n=1 Tax=Candidatus Carbonibacillus altaicus TaxID=2163959 RepID=A0A2R6Y1B8_9BACL|nr:MAG: hypothetical protein BSOLF_0185 [Candidatus Carbobacillus altaicus]